MEDGATRENCGSELGAKEFPLKLDWKNGPDMPIPMSGFIQSVKIGDILYVGGGDTVKDEDFLTVMTYNIESCEWHTLPPYIASCFAMTVINNKLVLIGGVVKKENCSSSTKELGEWQSDSNEWTHPYPPMPIPHLRPAVATYQHWLVVAGGWYGESISDVEVLDLSNMQWSTVPSLPACCSSMKSTVVGDTWYLMGGYCYYYNFGPQVYSVSLESLVSHSGEDSADIWKELPSNNCKYACPLNFRGSLLAIGGYNMESDMSKDEPESALQRYDPETNTWEHAGNLPRPLYDSNAIMISDKVYFMGGSDRSSNQLKDVFISNVM